MSANPPYAPGTVITGKWRGNRYVVNRLLGQGANGTVYLVQREGRREQYALKIGYDALDLQSEINVLTSLQSCRKRREHIQRREKSAPFLFESDDYGDGAIPFYVMQYVEGKPLHHFLSRMGPSWLGLVGMQLLEQLREVHSCGFVFGDLKPENVMVSDYGRTRLIDFGGASPLGRSVKQFTEWHDRGFWNAGGRSGDEGYDLFAFSVLCLRLLHEPELKQAARQLPQTRSVDDLLRIASGMENRKLGLWIKAALRGEFAGSGQARDAWKRHVHHERPRHTETRATPRWLSLAFTASLFLLAFTLLWVIRF